MVVGATIVFAHVAVIAALLTIGPRRAIVLPNLPIDVRFVAAPATKRDWQPPEVKAVTPSVITPMPDMPLFESPITAPSETAISVPTRATVAPPSDAGAPRLISTVEYLREPVPRYPPQSRRLREQGLVVLRVLIDERGTACSIEVETSSGFTRLDHAARQAVEGAAFRPYVEDGSPRRAFVLIPIEFSLNRGSA